MAINEADCVLGQDFHRKVYELREAYIKELLRRHPDVETRGQRICMFREAGWTDAEISRYIEFTNEEIRRRFVPIGS